MTSLAIFLSMRAIGAFFLSTVLVAGVSIFISSCNDVSIPVASEVGTYDATTSGKGATLLSGDNDIYPNVVPALIDDQVYGVDYQYGSRNPSSTILFAAIHGGNIEEGTTEIASNCAGGNSSSPQHDFYSFDGKKPANNTLYDNDSLHVTATHFNEKSGITRINNATKAIVLHGARNPTSSEKSAEGFGTNTKIIFVGGKDEALKSAVKAKLEEYFPQALVIIPTSQSSSYLKGYLGTSSSNFCNRTVSGKGVQLEMTWDFRKTLFTGGQLSTPAQRASQTWEMVKLAVALREVVE